MSSRIALVTGGTGAIGTEICRQLSAAGRKVIAVGHPMEAARVDDWKAAQAEHGFDIQAALVDVADFGATQTALESLAAEHGAPTIVVNAAGITRDASLRKMAAEAWQAVIATNLDSVFNVTRNLIDGMLEAGFGRVVNIASVNGQKGQFGQANYSAAKAGMHGFTMAVAQEVARRGITVNTVSPGYIDSPMIREVPENIRENILGGIPAARFGTPADIARTIVFLTADDADYITGANIPVNGGLFMH